MPPPQERRFRYGYLFHLDTPGLEQILKDQIEQAVAQWRDRDDPDLYSLAVDKRFVIKGRFDQDLFVIDREAKDELSASFFHQENTPNFEDALLYATEFWNNGGSFYISPREHAIPTDPQSMPNLNVFNIAEEVALSSITHYPVKLTKQIMRAFPGRLGYYPFQFRVTPPDPQKVRVIVQNWLNERDQDFQVALEILRSEHKDGWAFTTTVSRLGNMLPNPDGMEFVGDKDAAEQKAVDYWGPCFLVNLKSGQYESRWASR